MMPVDATAGFGIAMRALVVGGVAAFTEEGVVTIGRMRAEAKRRSAREDGFMREPLRIV
jgi:hypothetical protein